EGAADDFLAVERLVLTSHDAFPHEVRDTARAQLCLNAQVIFIAQVQPERRRYGADSHLNCVTVAYKLRSHQSAGYFNDESLLVRTRRYRQIAGGLHRLAEEVHLRHVDEVVASRANKVLMQLRDHRLRRLREPLRQPDARAEAAKTLSVRRRKRDHEDVEGPVVPGRNFVRAPAAHWQVVDFPRWQH